MPKEQKPTVTLHEMNFEARQSAALKGAVVEFTHEELDLLGAIPDDTPLTEHDYLIDEDGDHE